MISAGTTTAATHAGISSYLCNLGLCLRLCGRPHQGLDGLSLLHVPAAIQDVQSSSCEYQAIDCDILIEGDGDVNDQELMGRPGCRLVSHAAEPFVASARARGD